MAVKIVHERHGHQVRFGDRATAEHFAAQHGGLGDWRVVTIPGGAESRKSSGNQGWAELSTGE